MKKLRGYTADEIADARHVLINFMEQHKTFYALVTNVAPSGMSRRMKLFTIFNGGIINITFCVAIVTGRKLGKDNEMILEGCGMDVVLPVAMRLSQVLYGREDDVKYYWL